MTGAGTWLQEKAPALHRFLTRKDRPFPLLREILIGILAIALLVSLLYGLTGQSIAGGYPVVVVTSGSMMHCEGAYPDHPGPQLGKDCTASSYGRIGTIDPGDLVFVRRVFWPDQVATAIQPDTSSHYGNGGDVIVYRPHQGGADTRQTPIIHRALFWVEINSDGTYTVPGMDPPIDHAPGLGDKRLFDLANCNLEPNHGGSLGPSASGFITRGDNNGQADQCPGTFRGTGYDPVRVDYILGKARGELPWIGLVKLWVDDLTGNSSNFSNASSDSKVMLLVTVVVLIGAPWGLDLYMRRRHRKKQESQEADNQAAEPEPRESRRKGKGDS